MKRLTCLLAAALLFLAPCALADIALEINPEGYPLIEIYDIYTPEDLVPEGEVALTVVQGCFGEVDASKGEADMELIGFDEADVYTLEMTRDCVVLMPNDFMNLVENVPCDDPVAWFRDFSEKYYDIVGRDTLDEDGERIVYTALANFEMDEDGRITRLEYCYLPMW